MSGASPPPVPTPEGHILPPESQDEVFSILDMSFSSDGKILIAGSADKNIYTFDPNTGKGTGSIKRAHNEDIVSTCYIKDYQFVSGSVDSTIALWDLRKSTEAVNVLQGHGSCIRELAYNENCGDMLLSSSLDSTIRYWHIPSFQSQNDHQISDNEENEHYRGVLANCPNLSQLDLSPSGQLLTVVNSQGSVYIVYNLDIIQLSRIMKTLRFDDGLIMQLAWFNPNCSLTKKNRIRVITGDDYVPPHQGSVGKVLGIKFHPIHCFLLMRVSLSEIMGFGMAEWTCGVNLRQLQSSFDSSWITIHSYGSEVVEETLMFSRQEERSGLTDRKYSYSSCGRIFLSPGKSRVSLLGFSSNLDDPYACGKKKRRFPFGDMFMNADSFGSCNNFAEIGSISMQDGEVSCAKFSPVGILLAAGDKNGQVGFYQPSI